MSEREEDREERKIIKSAQRGGHAALFLSNYER